MRKKKSCNPYEGGKIPPCSEFLNNTDPIIKDGKLIFRNQNRLFCFLSTNPLSSSDSSSNCTNNYCDVNYLINSSPSVYTNIQISITTYLIGLYINQVQQGIIDYKPTASIHSNKSTNEFIHQLLQNCPKVNVDYIPGLSLVISNNSAIATLYSSTFNISPLNYYILFVLNRLENDPGLYFSNNSYAAPNPINLTLAALNIQF